MNSEPAYKLNHELLEQMAVLDSLQQLEENSQAISKNYNSNKVRDKTNSEKENASALFLFDPNTANEDEFLKLGFKDWQVKNIIKYRQKGGRFRKPEDIKKIYGVSEKQYQTILPFIKIAFTDDEKPEINQKEKASTPIVMLDLNACDSMQLIQLPAIGPWFANKIIRYRNRLGGFYSIQQLMEIKGFRQGMLDTIAPLIMIDPVTIQQLNINSAEIKELGTHPYIGYNSARILVNFRVQHGPYTSWKDVEKVMGLPADFKEKLLPYISF